MSKPDRRKVTVPIDYLGLEIPDDWVVGYGLDYAERYRTLPYIAVLKPSVFRNLKLCLMVKLNSFKYR